MYAWRALRLGDRPTPRPTPRACDRRADTSPGYGWLVQLVNDGSVILSATDLVGFLACDHLSSLELGRIEGRWERPHRRDDPTIALIQEKGDLHEAAYLARLRDEGRSVVEITTGDLRTPDDLRAAQTETLEAMRDGADVVFQATFFDGRWRGHADFLFKRPDRPSDLGSWSYDIADTKLARSVKGGAILQMCVYADLLQRLQGVPPETLAVPTCARTRIRSITVGCAPGSPPASIVDAPMTIPRWLPGYPAWTPSDSPWPARPR
jgi:hypothetical protein